MTTKIDLVNEAADWSEKAGNGVIATYLREYARLLEAREKAEPVADELAEFEKAFKVSNKHAVFTGSYFSPKWPDIGVADADYLNKAWNGWQARAKLVQAAVPDEFDAIYADIKQELSKAIAKFPTWPDDPIHAFAVLGEEVGELQKDVLQMVYEQHKTSLDNVKKEAMQTAAMALRFLHSIDRYCYAPSAQHKQTMLKVEESCTPKT